MRPARPIVQLDRVSKRFGAVEAVAEVDLEIAAGELFALLGGSGSGKTTLLRMLAGFERPSSGRILIDGADVTDAPPHARPVNMMFQSYALFPHMSVFDNVAYGLRRDGTPSAEIRRRVAEMLELVEMGAFARRRPHQLSGGQRQRVALVRALIKAPKVLLLDEPLGALDRRLREQTQFELVNLQERLGATFIMVTHDQEEAMTMASRIGVMRDGRLAQVGAPAEIYESPASRYVADFVGSVNLIECVVQSVEADRARARCDDLALEAAGDDPAIRPGAAIAVAIRPEKIVMTRVGGGASLPAGSANHAEGEIVEIQYLGDESVYHVRLPSGRRMLATLPNVARRAESPFTWGDRVTLTWTAQSAVALTR